MKYRKYHVGDIVRIINLDVNGGSDYVIGGEAKITKVCTGANNANTYSTLLIGRWEPHGNYTLHASEIEPVDYECTPLEKLAKAYCDRELGR